MTIVQALHGVTKLGLDSSPFIYFIERHSVYLAVMREIFRRIDTGRIMAYSSVVTLTEVMVHPKQLKQETIENNYRK
jgi:predicted nucleic acid-binding protein